MPNDRYQVQFTWEGQTKFGIVEEFIAEAKAAGDLIIEDATRAIRYRVPDDAQVIDIPLGIPLYYRATNQVVPVNDYERHVAREFELVQQRSREAGPGLVPGKWFSLLVGDGPAFYVVTKVGKKTARIEWRSFQAERWVDLHYGYGGTFPRSMIERLIVADERLAPLFGSPQKDDCGRSRNATSRCGSPRSVAHAAPTWSLTFISESPGCTHLSRSRPSS